MHSIDATVEVLIAGAGPVGLAAAIELGSRNVRCLVVERNDRVGYSPRAKTTNVRSREHLRRWGIAAALRAASPFSADFPATVLFATRMDGPELARFENALNADPARNDLYSEEAQWVPQYVLEDVLRKHACSLPTVTVEFNTELTSFSEGPDSVSCDLLQLESGSTLHVSSAYLIGADGARSLVRDRIGATLQGDRAFFRNHNIIFRSADLASRQRHGRALMYWMVNEDVPSLLSPLDEEGLWSLIATKLPDNVGPDGLDPVELIRRATGFADLPLEIIANYPWVAHQLIADRYSTRRVVLAGDACHLHPPFGGFGMNMGIGDAVDLGWKIAAVLQGWGGPHLFESYTHERRPAHQRTIAEAVHNYGAVGNQLVRPGLEASGASGEATRREIGEIILATKTREFKTLGLVLGYRYQSSLIVADGSTAPVEDATVYVPSAHPGCLAPHLWLRDGSSLYDHFGPGFTLLISKGDPSDARALITAAAARKLPLTVLSPDDSRLAGRYETRFALIRPDQHVAWRGESLPLDCDALLAQVSGFTEHVIISQGTMGMPGVDGVRTMTDEIDAEIRRLEARRIQALLAKDWPALGGLLADDLVHIHANGMVEDKASYLQTMATTFEILKLSRPSLDVRVLGSAAIVTGPLNQQLRLVKTDTLIDLNAIATQIWRKSAAGWAQCAFQATRVG